MVKIVLGALALLAVLGVVLSRTSIYEIAVQKLGIEASGQTETVAGLQQWTTTLRDDGKNAVFSIPATDVMGAANGAANGCASASWGTLPCVLAPINTATREGAEGWAIHMLANAPHAFDEWSQDALGNMSWSEWYFDSTKHQIELWRYSSRDALGNVLGLSAAPDRVIPNVAWMQAEMMLASQTPTASPFVRSALVAKGRTICANDGTVHLYTASMQPAAPACYPYDSLEHMVGSPREILGGNDFLVVRYQGLPGHDSAALAKIPANGTRSTDWPELWNQEVIAGAPVPFGRKVTLNYTPPPPGGMVVSPTFLWYQDSGTGTFGWYDSSGLAQLPNGGQIAIAQSWYGTSWTLPTTCTDMVTGSPVSAASLLTMAGASGSNPWLAAASSTFQAPVLPWPSGPFSGQTVGYAEATPTLGVSSVPVHRVECGIQVASAHGESEAVTVRIDPDIAALGTPTPPGGPTILAETADGTSYSYFLSCPNPQDGGGEDCVGSGGDAIGAVAPSQLFVFYSPTNSINVTATMDDGFNNHAAVSDSMLIAYCASTSPASCSQTYYLPAVAGTLSNGDSGTTYAGTLLLPGPGYYEIGTAQSGDLYQQTDNGAGTYESYGISGLVTEASSGTGTYVPSSTTVPTPPPTATPAPTATPVPTATPLCTPFMHSKGFC